MRSPDYSGRGIRLTRPALLTDLPVALLLLAGFFSVTAGAVGHVVAGTLFLVASAVHLATRPALAARLWRSLSGHSRAVRSRITNWVVLTAVVVNAVSGAVQWAGVSAMMPVHSTSSYLLILVVGVHVWQRRHALATRLRRPSAEHV